MTHTGPPWPPEIARYRWEGADVRSLDRVVEERAGHDSIGTPGLVRTVRWRAILRENLLLGAVQRRLEASGMRTVSAVTERIDLAEPPVEPAPEDFDPFVLERRVGAVVRGRTFPGQQRAVIEAKAERLRAEVGDTTTDPERRAEAAQMLRNLEDGLATHVEIRSVVRRFKPAVVVDQPRDAMGEVLKLPVGARIVYRVESPGETPSGEEDGGVMVFHLVAIGAKEAVVLHSGGVHGLRHLTDLDDSRAHDAWFANRDRSRTDATAPWIGRVVYAELRDQGWSALYVHRHRDPDPISLRAADFAEAPLRVDGVEVTVPVLRCRSERGDEMDVLADAENPLVLRFVEKGAGLVRTVCGIRTRVRDEAAEQAETRPAALLREVFAAGAVRGS